MKRPITLSVMTLAISLMPIAPVLAATPASSTSATAKQSGANLSKTPCEKTIALLNARADRLGSEQGEQNVKANKAIQALHKRLDVLQKAQAKLGNASTQAEINTYNQDVADVDAKRVALNAIYKGIEATAYTDSHPALTCNKSDRERLKKAVKDAQDSRHKQIDPAIKQVVAAIQKANSDYKKALTDLNKLRSAAAKKTKSKSPKPSNDKTLIVTPPQ